MMPCGRTITNHFRWQIELIALKGDEGDDKWGKWLRKLSLILQKIEIQLLANLIETVD
jgi:hypothetical protein